MNIEHYVFDELKFKFGSHSEAARQLGLQPRQYREIRRTLRTTKTLHKLILLLNNAPSEYLQTLSEPGKELPCPNQPQH